MSQAVDKKEALKAVRAARAEVIKRAAKASSQQMKDMVRITRVLKKGPATAPEVARATGLSPQSAMWYLAAMRKYGQVAEAAQSGDWFSYELIEKAEDQAQC